MSKRQDDLFDGLLDLEETFYNEGYDLGVTDGKRAGLIEGRFFGLEKGFEKYAIMGHLYGRAVVWSGRLPPLQIESGILNDHKPNLIIPDSLKLFDRQPKSEALEDGTEQLPIDNISESTILSVLPENARLEKHIRTLYALAEPISLSTENTEDAVADFDDRLKRAEAKMKIIEKLTGETNPTESRHGITFENHMIATKSQKMSGDGSIEDTSSLHVRH